MRRSATPGPARRARARSARPPAPTRGNVGRVRCPRRRSHRTPRRCRGPRTSSCPHHRHVPPGT
ncbi:hypothetical protein CWIS_10410 [Cellulomonas sp. A375-1]|nr:hypothetical protein CWIS_10410 [Cellulomonas sp. A375-1]